MLSLPTVILAALVAIATLSPLAAAHSWVEEYQRISDNGSYTGPRGYSRGFVSRADPTYNGFSMMWMLPSLDARQSNGAVRSRINSSDLLCHPAQRTSNYTAAFPKLKLSPGDYVAAKYLENGHVTLPWNITGKPPGSGTIFIFATTQPSDTEKIADVMRWNPEGTGGNGRGFLLTAQNFDDGRCHQINCGSISAQRQMLTPNHVAGQPTSTVESWCETDIQIPANLTTGTLTTYWVWQWPTEPNADCNTPAGKDEYYTTCADFDIVDPADRDHQMAATPDAGANPQSVAVSDYKSRTASTAAPLAVVTQQNDTLVGDVAGVDPAFVSACSAQAPVVTQYHLGLWPEVYVPNSCSVVSSFGAAAASAAAHAFSTAAASYAAGATSAWSAAFAAAKLPLPTRTAWSQPPHTGAPATATATPSRAPPPPAITPYLTTITLVSTVTPPAASASASASSAPASDSAPAAPTITTTTTTTSPARYPTISTVGTPAPSSNPAISPRARPRPHPRHWHPSDASRSHLTRP